MGKIKIAVSGANGFLGKNLLAILGLSSEYVVQKLDRNENSKIDADFLIHLAAANRPQDPSDFHKVNVEYTLHVLKRLNTQKLKGIYLSSSIHADRSDLYGQSKKNAEEIITQFGDRHKVNVLIDRLPGLFGKWSKPEYNTVVATFINNLINGKELRIDNPNNQLSLLSVDDVVNRILSFIKDDVPSELEDVKISVKELADMLSSFHSLRQASLIPEFNSKLEENLWMTFISFLDEGNMKIVPKKFEDDRGWLSELIKGNIKGQIFFSSTKPGVTRGNHWHNRKLEKFIVLKGEAKISFRDINCDNEESIQVSGDTLSIIDIPPGKTHNITNVGNSELLTLFWTNEIYDSKKPDTNFLVV